MSEVKPRSPSSHKSRPLSFVKMHGLGNDFVMVSDTQIFECLGEEAEFRRQPVAVLGRLAEKLCDRRFGIGGDGLIVALRSRAHGKHLPELLDILEPHLPYLHTQLPYSWIYTNSDGSASAMCGNGLRCLALFMQHLGWGQATDSFAVSTAAYPVRLTGQSISADRAIVSTNLAGPTFDCAKIPCAPGQGDRQQFVARRLEVGDLNLTATAVGMGNPHCVIFDSPALNLSRYADSMQGIYGGNSASFLSRFPAPLWQLAEQIQSLPEFPQGVNVEFVLPLSSVKAQVFVVERGCGPTLACGSGALAVVAAGVTEGLLKRECCVILPGGELEVRWSEMDNSMELIGPAQLVYAGQVELAFESIFSSAASGKNLGAVV